MKFSWLLSWRFQGREAQGPCSIGKAEAQVLIGEIRPSQQALSKICAANFNLAVNWRLIAPEPIRPSGANQPPVIEPEQDSPIGLIRSDRTLL
jgi:hypothetical protein